MSQTYTCTYTDYVGNVLDLLLTHDVVIAPTDSGEFLVYASGSDAQEAVMTLEKDLESEVLIETAHLLCMKVSFDNAMLLQQAVQVALNPALYKRGR